MSITLHAIDVDEHTSAIDILSRSYIFIDETNRLSTEQVLQKTFVKNDQKSLGLGFAPETALWIRFTLKNITDKPLEKILEYGNPETEYLYFYDGKNVQPDGMWNMHPDRKTINPVFRITLEAEEERVYYVKAEAPITAFIAILRLWDKSDFVAEDFRHKNWLFVFFSTIFTLLIYNAMLLVFTKDKVYFYYILYLAGIILFESIYLGVAQLYLFSNAFSMFVTKATIGYLSLFVIPMVLFAREFLTTKQFVKQDRIFIAYLYIIPIVAVLSYDNLFFDQNITAYFIPLGLALLYTGFYALYHGVKQAKYYLLGWSVVIVSLLLSIFKSFAMFDLSQYFAYHNEVAFSMEALLFSIALAHRINILNEQKKEADEKLIKLQKEEQTVLKKLVKAKTKDLERLLTEKELLYKELNHRVKNNLEMILSLVNLQIAKTKSPQMKEELTVTMNRVRSIAKLYEVLHFKDSDTIFDSALYCEKIVENIRSHFATDVTTHYEINYNLSLEHIIYCGLIINELVTNAFKYAFDQSGEIFLAFRKGEDYRITLIIEDNGKGFPPAQEDSLGLTIVNTLVQKQLFGEIDIDSISGKGTKITITWDEHA